MMELWIIYKASYNTIEENASHRMLKEALEQDIVAELKFMEYFEIKNDDLFYQNIKVVKYPKVIFYRGHEIALITYFEKQGVRVINKSTTIEIAKDKWLTYKLVQDLNILQPKTELLKDNNYNYYQSIYGNEFIIKYRYGSQGVGIYLIKNEKEYNDVLKDLEIEDYLVQQYIKSSYGKDVRSYFVGSNNIGYVIRESANDFKANVNQGGKSYHYEPKDQSLTNLALQIKEAIQGDIISVDFLIGNNEYYFSEINTNAGFSSYIYLGYPMRKYMMEYIKEIISKI